MRIPFVVALLLGAGACGGRSPLLLPKDTTQATSANTKGGEGPPSTVVEHALDSGDKAPPTSLPTDAGATWTLGDALAQGPVVIVFYRGDWCPFCRKQLTELEGHRSRFTAKQATVVALSVDPPDRSHALSAQLGLGFPILSDPDRRAIKAWGVDDEDNALAWPSVFIVGKDGTIVQRWLATSIEVRPTADDVLSGLP
jgi:peroxiredoxin